jgi:hypothetical protein
MLTMKLNKKMTDNALKMVNVATRLNFYFCVGTLKAKMVPSGIPESFLSVTK